MRFAARHRADGVWPALHFATPVWGPEYIRLFLDTVVPSLLAPGNLPAVPNRSDCLYRIFTVESDFDRIRAHASYAALCQLLEVELIDTGGLFRARRAADDNTTKYNLMTVAYNEAVARADKSDSASVFLNADMILSDGSLANMVGIFRAGARAIEIVGFRTNKQAMEKALHGQWKKGNSIAIPSRALVDLSLRNIHRISRRHFWENPPDKPFLPYHTYWEVRDKGIISRATHLYPLLVFPERKFSKVSHSIDMDLLDHALASPRHAHVIQDSDAIYSCELSDADYDINVQLGPKRLEEMRYFLQDKKQCTSRHLATLRKPILIHRWSPYAPVWYWARLKTWIWVNAVTETGIAYVLVILASKAEAYAKDVSRFASRCATSVSNLGWRAALAVLLMGALIPLMGLDRARATAVAIVTDPQPVRRLTRAASKRLCRLLDRLLRSGN